MDFCRIGARKSNLPGKNENIQGRCIPSACQSVYCEIFVPHRETMRLPQNREFHGKTERLRGLIIPKGLQ